MFAWISRQYSFKCSFKCKVERRISEKRVARAGKEFTSLIPNEDMDIIRIIKLLEDSGILIDGVTETVKHET